jgi:hypothetical protein
LAVARERIAPSFYCRKNAFLMFLKEHWPTFSKKKKIQSIRVFAKVRFSPREEIQLKPIFVHSQSV